MAASRSTCSSTGTGRRTRAASAQVCHAPDPGAAKALGRQVRSFDEARWAAHRFDVVVAGNLAKFGLHADLRQFLAGTGDRVLAEAAARDTIWGNGPAADDERAASPEHWRGRVGARDLVDLLADGDRDLAVAGVKVQAARLSPARQGQLEPAAAGLAGQRCDRRQSRVAVPALIADGQIRAACTVAALLLLYHTRPG